MSNLARCMAIPIAGAIALSAAAADPAVFAPNHLFVADRLGRVIHEFDDAFAHVRAVDLSGLASQLTGLAFGPDGNLTVCDFAGTLLVLDADFNVVRSQSNLGTYAHDLAYGMDGRQYISLADNNHAGEYDKLGTFVAARGSTSLPVGMEIDPAGNLYLSGWGPAEIVCADRSGPNLASFGGAIATDPWEMRFGPAGRLFVTDDTTNTVLELDVDGVLIQSFGDALGWQGPQTMAFGPDGAMYVGDSGSLRVHRVDLEGNLLTTLGDTVAIGTPYGLAWSPFRLAAKVSGTFHRAGGSVKVKEKDALLLIAPHSNTFFLRFVDDPEDAKDLATLTGSDQWVFNGYDHGDAEDPATRVLTGSTFATNVRSGGSAFAALLVNGALDGEGMFRVHTASGDLHYNLPHASFLGSIKATTVLETAR